MNICLHSYKFPLYKVVIKFLISCHKLLLAINTLVTLHGYELLVHVYIYMCTYMCVCVHVCI